MGGGVGRYWSLSAIWREDMSCSIGSGADASWPDVSGVDDNEVDEEVS